MPALIGGHFWIDSRVVAETGLGSSQNLEVYPAQATLVEGNSYRVRESEQESAARRKKK